MEINAKFYMFKGIRRNQFFCESVATSLDVLVDLIIESYAKFYAYKIGEDELSYFSKRVQEIKGMSDEEMLQEAFNLNVIRDNIILPTIPKIIIENCNNFNEMADENYEDVTESVVKQILDKINISEIKEFVSTHNDDEILEKYCVNKNFEEFFWDI
jgi:hypothetical protein